MKKISSFSLLLLFGFITFGASGKPLTPEEALSRLETTGAARKARAEGETLSLKYTLSDKEAQPTLYIFGRTGNSGFVIASADDFAFPMLGYSDDNSFDPSNIPPELNFWLGEYSRQIAIARADKAYASATLSPQTLADDGMEAISPLLKTKWNQGEPYNRYCFELSSTGEEIQSVTGCVATSMAQVMYYFKEPAIGHGQISYKHGDSGTYEMDFGSQAFAWNEMLPTYYPDSYNSEEADAVAYLMKACGYSVKMDYGKGESGANGADIPGALINYFGYNQNIELQTRAYYTYSDWVKMIYNNLKNVGPVIYDGSALDGGHSFVCDGYDGNGYFHINWGWGGMSDGYYLLDALNPDEFGIGGAAGGYNLGQQVILNITPGSGEAITPQLMQFGSAEGSIADSKLSLKITDTDRPGFQYINPAPITLTFGIEVVNMTNSTQEPQYFESEKKDIEGKQSSFFTWDEVGTAIDLSKVNMTNGDEYNFIIVTKITLGEETQWSEVVPVPGKYNYVTVKKVGEGYEIIDNTIGNIKVSDFEILSSPVYWNKPVKFSANFANESSSDLTRNYSAVFFDKDGKECYKMENYSINVNAGETLSDSWTSINWYKEDGAGEVTEATEFIVKLYDNWQGEYVDGIEENVTVEPETGKAKVESTLTIDNGEKEGDIYIIKGNELEVSLNVKVTEGLFNHTIMLALQAPKADGGYMTIMHKHFDAIPNLKAGEEETYSMTVEFDDLESDKTYKVEVWGPDGGFNETALVKFELKTEGVGALVPDAGGSFTVYGIDGTLKGHFDSLDSILTLPKGLYIVNGKKVII